MSMRLFRCRACLALALLLCAPVLADEPLDLARAAIAQGRFAAAEELLAPLVKDRAAPVVDESAKLLEIMRRIRIDFGLTPDAMLAKLRGRVPDATAADVDRWREQGVLQHRVIDGKVWYFSTEPANLFRFSDEARKRRAAQPQPSGAELDLPAHLARLVAASAGDSPLVCPTIHSVRYSLRVKENHPRVRAGAVVRCWLPFPQEYRTQRDVALVFAEPPAESVSPSGAPHRTVYFEQTIADPSKPLRFTIEFEYISHGYVPKLDPAIARPLDRASDIARQHLGERPPHIVFTPEIRRIVATACGDEPNPLERARKLFLWVCENIRYCSEMEYSTIFNIPGKALDVRRGDCGVQGLLYITLCRAAGVPARWQSGWESLPGGENMHDWCEVYVDPWGWLPVDPSYGLQRHADPAVREFYFGHIDPYRMIVNLDYAAALSPAKTSFRSEPNDFQRGEIEIDGHNLYFDEWDWDFEVQTRQSSSGAAWIEESFDAIVPGLLKAEKIPGAVVAVGARDASGGFRTWQKAYGFLQSLPQPRPMPVDAMFDMASLSKPIGTGTSLAILIERGKLSLDDRVSRFIPEFDTDSKRAITVRQLVTHTSGLPPYLEETRRKEIREQVGEGSCRAATRQAIREIELANKPGEKFVYSCLNAILCGEIVEQLSGQTLDRFAAENVFAPLRMAETGYSPGDSLRERIAPSTKRSPADEAYICGVVHDPLAWMQDGVSGNAGVFSTVADLHRFAQMMLRGGELDGARVLREETVRLATSVLSPGAVNSKGDKAERGMLWELYPEAKLDGVRMPDGFGHTGYTGVAMRIYPEAGYYVIALTNRVHPDDTSKVEGFRRGVWVRAARHLAPRGEAAGR